MTEDKLLVYFPDPYGVGNSRYFVLAKGAFVQVDGGELGEMHTIITFDVPTLVDDLRTNNYSLPEQLIDISDAIRLSVGISRADGGEKKYNFWLHVRSFFYDIADWKAVRAMYNTLAAEPDAGEFQRLLGRFSEAISSLWAHQISELKRLGEFDRFFEIEVPAAQIFYRRQITGIRIDRANVAGFTQDASRQKYVAYQAVSKALDVSASGLTYWNIGGRLKGSDLDLPDLEVTGYALRDQMKIAAQTSLFAREFTAYLDASRDLDILSRLSDGSDRIYPTFHCIGTISSRILVADPYIQELKRRYRSILTADDGCRLSYFDYAQFEPGVMASLADDPSLIELYNRGDVYKALSEAVYGDSEHRQLCKRIFLAFSYGMSSKGIAKLLVGKNDENSKSLDIEEKIDNFFLRFKTLSNFKASLEATVYRDGCVATLMGNNRRRVQRGNLTFKEKRWAVSQVIQGTASLIFKRALIDVSDRFGSDTIILPMHDAMLVQFPVGDAATHEGEVCEIMKQAFARYCPRVAVRITRGSFAEESV